MPSALLRVRFGQRPDLHDAPHLDGRQSAGEVEDRVVVVALEQVEGTQSFACLGCGTLRCDELVRAETDGRGERWGPKPVVRDHAHRGAGRCRNLVVERAMPNVEGALVFWRQLFE